MLTGSPGDSVGPGSRPGRHISARAPVLLVGLLARSESQRPPSPGRFLLSGGPLWVCVCSHLISTLAPGFFSAATAEGERGAEEHSGFPMQGLLWPLPWGSSEAWRPVVLRRRLLTVTSWEVCPYGWVFPGPALAAYQSQGAAHPAAHLHQGSWSLAVPVSSPVLDLGAVKT